MRAVGPLNSLRIAFCAVVLVGPQAGARADTPQPVGLTLDRMSYVLSRGGEVDLVIEAAHAEVSPVTRRVELSGVRARMGSLAGAARELGGFELVCAHGTLDLDKGEFTARGAVAGRLPDGRQLATESLRYEHRRGFVSSDAPVALSDESGDYRGGGFQFWVRENRFRLIRGARILQGGS